MKKAIAVIQDSNKSTFYSIEREVNRLDVLKALAKARPDLVKKVGFDSLRDNDLRTFYDNNVMYAAPGKESI